MMNKEVLHSIKSIVGLLAIFAIVGLGLRGILKLTDNKIERSRQLVKSAEVYLNQGQTDDAIRLLTSAIKADTTNINACALRAGCFLAAKKYEKAITDANIVIQKTNLASAYIIRAQAHMGLENTVAAFADFTKSLEITETIEAHNGLADILMKSGEVDRAVEHYSKANNLKSK